MSSISMYFALVFIFLSAACSLAASHDTQVQRSRSRPTKTENDAQYCSQAWTYYSDTTGRCDCGASILDVLTVRCGNQTDLLLQNSYCMTYSCEENTTYVGLCPYSSIISSLWGSTNQTSNSTELNKRTCGVWNRKGRLCSECIEGYGVPVYSYHFQCVKCSNATNLRVKEIALFVIRAFLPLTVMCIIITLFRINVLLPPWNMFVLASQFFSVPPLVQASFSRAVQNNNYPQKIGVAIMATIFGPWNLDFFRALYSPMCLSPRINNIHISALDGIIGLYPLTLLVLFYLIVKLHDCGCVVVVKLWRPFNICLVRCRHRLDLKSSLMHAFSTFILLSYTKIGIAAFYILVPTKVYTPQGDYSLYVYIYPSLMYFKSSHFVYGLVTLALGTMVLMVPMVLLCLYPYRCFQRCLNHFHLRSLALNAFVDAFQGCYKDGTNGTRDCRHFSVIHFLLRFKMLLLFGLTQKPLIYAFLATILLILFIGLFAVVRPYKNEVYNRTDMFILIPILLFNVMCIFHEIPLYQPYMNIRTFCMCLSVAAPLLYLFVWMVIKWKRQCCRLCTLNTVYTLLKSPVSPAVHMYT